MKRSLLLAFLVINSLSINVFSDEYSTYLDKVVVTSTQESKPISELAESVGVLEREDIEVVSPSHPSEILNRTAGVYINNLGGEGHMTAIRQPITTGGVYLFLEDGVPTRPTGFFNHNGLYEVNIPQSQSLEVTKGPGSALYGSDAIGGIINSISAKVPEEPETKVNAEFGQYNWHRLLVSSGRSINHNTGAAISANITQNDSFRDDARYERYSLNGRIKNHISPSLNMNTSLSFTQVDQSGVSSLEEGEYKNDVERNEYRGDVGARDVDALRVTSVITYAPSQRSQLTFTPFYRNNQTTMMPSWMVTYDANFRETVFQSIGLLSKWRHNFSKSIQFIAGVDLDHTPSEYVEYQVTVEQDGDFYTGFERTGELNYDYSADQTSISPYLHLENKIGQNIVTHIGLRYDRFEVDYENNVDAPLDFRHRRPDSQTIEYDHYSPKAGLTIALNKNHNVYANYRHGFRTPSIGQLFRSGSSAETDKLKPVKTDSVELGFRGLLGSTIGYEVAVYHMEKTDDIVNVINSDDTRVSVNAGETTHQGIELGLSGPISQELSFNTSFTATKQTYGDFSYTYFCFSCNPQNQVVNFDGNEVGKAPSTLGNVSVRYEPLALHSFMLELEWEHVGDYFTDETNTQKYSGHYLINLRSQYQITSGMSVYGRIQNLTDKRYSTYTSNQVGSEEISYRPGAPLTVFAGIRAAF